MKSLGKISQIILGLVFIFSGFVKGIDPYGLTYKITDYLVAFHWDALIPFAFFFSIFLSFAEFAIGVALISGFAKQMASLFALLFMAIFTPLTLYIALKNPVTDCGCFGDALIITNWQTFYKNLLLSLMAVLVFALRKKLKPTLHTSIRQTSFSFLLVGYILTVYWCYNHLPIIDFRPYKVGTNIKEAMTIPEDAPADVYRSTYYYQNKRSGEIKPFSDENLPWQDSLTWEYHSMDEPILVSKGYEPSIHDFYIETPEGDDVADYFLEDENYTFMLVAYNLGKASRTNLSLINELSNWAESENYNFICLTASLREEQDKFQQETEAPYPVFNCDEVTLKTIIRSNPGLLLTHHGTILKKWHVNDIPELTEFKTEVIPEMNKKLNRN